MDLCPHCRSALNPGATVCARCGATKVARLGLVRSIALTLSLFPLGTVGLMLLIQGASSLGAVGANPRDAVEASLAITIGVVMLLPAVILVTEAARNSKTLKRAEWVRRVG
jgi:hypothetical protein